MSKREVAIGYDSCWNQFELLNKFSCVDGKFDGKGIGTVCREHRANEPKVKGFLVADWEGLCIASRGVAPSQSSGWITSIAEASLMLRKDMKTENKEPPFIQVDLGKYVVAVRPLESVILAVYRESDGKQ